MPRKKTPTSSTAAAAAINLDDDEQFIEEVTTVKKIGREKRKPAAEETIDGELIDDDGDFDDDTGDEPRFADNSIASMLFNDDGEQRFEDQFCTISIRRKPDSMNDKFLTPCAAVTNLPPLRNIEVTADKFDIEDRVRSEYGGGHYYFQIFFDGRLRSSWQSTLADDPAAVARAKAAANAANHPELAAAQTPTQPVDPLDSMIASITKMQLLKEAMFGDEQKRLEAQIAELKAQVASKPEAQPETKSEQLYILEKALGTQNPSLQEKLLDYAFPADSGGHWITETVKTLFEHKDEIAPILGGLLGGLAGQRPAAPPNIAAMLKQQPPAGALPPQPEPQPQPVPQSSFRRKPVESPTPADTGDEADARSETVIDAEIEEPSADFLASLSISPDEISDPLATVASLTPSAELAEILNHEPDSDNATEKTENAE